MKSAGILPLVLFVSAALLAGCKKDDESSSGSTSKSMSGTLYIGSMPEYIKPSEVFRFDRDEDLKVSQEDADKGIEVTYSYSCTAGTISDSTFTGFKYTAPDSVGAVSVTMVAKATGYYSRSAVLNSIVVGAKSLNVPPSPAEVTIGETTWSRFNLADTTKAGICYKTEGATLPVLGAFYDGAEVLLDICPQGYQVPSLEQWNKLVQSIGDAGELMAANLTFNGDKMWNHYAQNVFHLTDAKQFSAIPCGYAEVLEGMYHFDGWGNYACFWALDKSASPAVPVCCYLQADSPEPGIWNISRPQDIAANVRCVRKDN